MAWRTIGVTDNTYFKLENIKKKLEAEKGKKLSINDVITELINLYIR